MKSPSRFDCIQKETLYNPVAGQKKEKERERKRNEVLECLKNTQCYCGNRDCGLYIQKGDACKSC